MYPGSPTTIFYRLVSEPPLFSRGWQHLPKGTTFFKMVVDFQVYIPYQAFHLSSNICIARSTALPDTTFLRSALSGVEAEVVKAETQAVLGRFRGRSGEVVGGLDG